MIIPKTKSSWKRLQPSNLKEALRLNKEYARHFHRLTVPAIAELMNVSEDTLYKWLSTGHMPLTAVPAYEHICHIDYVTQYMAYRSHKLIIDIPNGKKAKPIEIAALQQIAAQAMTQLIAHYHDKEEAEDLDKTVEVLTQLIGGVAYHRENIQTQPDIFAGAEQ